MKISKLFIPIYEWKVTMIEVESSDDSKPITKMLKKINADKEEIDKMVEKTKTEINSGTTFTCAWIKQFIVIIYKNKNLVERDTTIYHELRHVVDDILEFTKIKDIEAAAYLQGYVFSNILKDRLK
jgi:Zn-dependent peptidase ImmA (M78 family)